MNTRRNRLLVLGALALAGVLALGVLWQYRGEIDRDVIMGYADTLRSWGPWVFFSVMAIAPLFWMPLSPFLLVAPLFGTWVAIGGSATALSINIFLAWLVSSRWCRPLALKVVKRLGYEVPRFSDRGLIGATVLLRLTPGVPFPLQNYLLGLARMPLGIYMMVSLPLVWLVSISVILLGDSVMKGSLRQGIFAIAAAVAVALLARWARARLQARSRAAAASES